MTGGRRNTILASAVVAAMVGMVGMSFAAIPLYRLFCAATGYGGTPSIGPLAAPGSSGQTIRVRFNADTNPGLPWLFAPAHALPIWNSCNSIQLVSTTRNRAIS